MSKRCDKGMAGVYRRGDGLPLCRGGRSVLSLWFALLVSICMLTVPVGGPMAQPAPAPVEQSTAKTDTNGGMTAADIAAARQQQRTTAATRQQIQAIRAALRARLAALHR